MRALKIFLLIFILPITIASQESGWFSQYGGTTNVFLCVFATDPDNAWIGTQEDGIILRTTDGGEHWNQIIIDPNKRVASIYFINQNIGWCISSDFTTPDIYKTIDGGLTWVKKFSDNIDLSSIYFINENIGWAVGHSYTSGRPGRVVKSTDGGENWKSTYTFEINDYPEDVCFLNEEKGFIVGQAVLPGKIFKSTDGGFNWNEKNIPTSLDNISFADSLHGIAVGGPYVVRTADGGESWEELFSGIEDIQSVSNRYPLSWMTAYPYILYTTDFGEKLFPQYKTDGYFHDVFFVNDTVGWAVGGFGRILKTINGGRSNVGYPQIPNLLLPANGETANLPVYFEWHEISYSAAQLQVSSDSLFLDTVINIRIIPNYFHSYELNSYSKYFWRVRSENINGYSEWSQIRYFYTGITKIDDDKNTIVMFSLIQNYPNPFNPSTKISWQAPVSGWQTLKVYDVLGNEVATLVDEYRNAGSYEVEFKSTAGSRQLANGVYFYQLKAGDYLETKKMILLK